MNERSLKRRSRLRTLAVYLAFFVGMPLLLLVGVLLFKGERYLLISLLMALFTCLPFFIRFEKRRSNAREMAILSVMVALSVLGRLVFAPIPAFKPVSAFTVITGIAFGPQAGFIAGSLTAIISNVFFGQGPWTPFQMLIWGLLGFLSGVFFPRGRVPRKWKLIVAGILSGFLFSIGMDLYTTLSTEGGFSFERYFAYAFASLPTSLCYACSNVVFLLFLTHPLLEKTERMRIRFGVFAS